MAKVTSDMSMSLDGFITGPNDDVRRPLGEGGKTNRDAEVLDEAWHVGAVVMGRRMFNHGEKPWGDNPPFHMRVFVVTHQSRPAVTKEGGTTFNFATHGIESALEEAKAAAGGKDVSVAGGANIVQQFLKAGLLDEIQIHLVPVTLGGGRRLFEKLDEMEFEPTRVIESPGVTHLRYRVKSKGDCHG